jgi:uncharacterized membrane protein
MQISKRIEPIITWKPSEWLAPFLLGADRQRRLTLIVLAMIAQSLVDAPHGIVGAIFGSYDKVFQSVMMTASLVLLIYAVVSPANPAFSPRAWLTKTALALGVVMVLFGAYQLSNGLMANFSQPTYPNDGTSLDHYAALMLLQGKDPYEASSMVAAAHTLHQQGEFTTPLRLGPLANISWLDYPKRDELRALMNAAPNYPASASPEFESHVSYPALAFLALLPFVWAGLPSVAIFTIICWVAFAIFAWRAVEPALRPWLVLALLADVPVLEAVASGESDILVMVLIFLAWLWWERPMWSTVALGLALAAKQQAWFFALFFAIFLIQRLGWRAAAQRLLGAGAIFFAINAPFILHDPHAWLAGIAAPLADPMWPLGSGLITLANEHILPLWPQQVYSVLTLLSLGIALIWYTRVGARRYPVTALVLATLPFWFAWRSLSTYFFFGALPMLVLWMVWQQAPEKETGTSPAPVEGTPTLVLAEEHGL